MVYQNLVFKHKKGSVITFFTGSSRIRPHQITPRLYTTNDQTDASNRFGTHLRLSTLRHAWIYSRLFREPVIPSPVSSSSWPTSLVFTWPAFVEKLGREQSFKLLSNSKQSSKLPLSCSRLLERGGGESLVIDRGSRSDKRPPKHVSAEAIRTLGSVQSKSSLHFAIATPWREKMAPNGIKDEAGKGKKAKNLFSTKSGCGYGEGHWRPRKIEVEECGARMVHNFPESIGCLGVVQIYFHNYVDTQHNIVN